MFPAKLMGGLALATALLAAAPASAEKLRTHFDTDSAGRAPGFFDLVVWGAPGNADWIVLGDVNPPSTPNKLIQTIDNRPAGSIAIALRRKYEFRDGEVSVGLRRGGGQSGIAFRASGEKDFVLVLVDGASGEARATSWAGGKATELARGKAVLDHEWGTLSIKASGPSIGAFWNGKPLLTATDPHPMAGRVGLATAGPGQASFDELVFDVAASAP
ncbi:MAG TPA: family 16 glycoside hydrolase [Thermoanaerobaculia bacterium]|nr:family 16 glycoside hydrolase [Thermoanaerobaculia bacterium]